MNLVTLGNTKENDKEAWVLMGRQALTSKESELARSPSKSVKTPSPQGIPRVPREPPIFTSGLQKAAQQTPVLGSGS